MQPLISRLDRLVGKYWYRECFRYLHPTIRNAQDEVMKIIEERKAQRTGYGFGVLHP